MLLLAEDGFEQGGPGGISNMTFHLIEGLNNNINYTFYVLSFTDAASNASESVTCTPGNYIIYIKNSLILNFFFFNRKNT